MFTQALFSYGPVTLCNRRQPIAGHLKLEPSYLTSRPPCPTACHLAQPPIPFYGERKAAIQLPRQTSQRDDKQDGKNGRECHGAQGELRKGGKARQHPRWSASVPITVGILPTRLKAKGAPVDQRKPDFVLSQKQQGRHPEGGWRFVGADRRCSDRGAKRVRLQLPEPLRQSSGFNRVTVCWTTEGLHETLTNPDSVKGQVAHPSPRCTVNQRRVA